MGAGDAELSRAVALFMGAVSWRGAIAGLRLYPAFQGVRMTAVLHTGVYIGWEARRWIRFPSLFCLHVLSFPTVRARS